MSDKLQIVILCGRLLLRIWDNPVAAAEDFLQQHPEFIGDNPPWPFNESPLTENVTHWSGAWLRRKEYP